MAGLTRAEIRARTGVPNETLTRVLWPYWQARRARLAARQSSQLPSISRER